MRASPLIDRRDSKKRIDDSEALEILTVGKVFGIEGFTTESLGSGHDGRVPVRNLKPSTKRHCPDDQLEIDRFDRGVGGEFQGGIDAGLGDSQGRLA